jgi:hypothetical protein
MSKYLLQVVALASLLGCSSAAYSASAPVVVDASGKIVGTLIGQNRVMREIGGLMVGFDVTEQGFNDDTNFTILYATSDCTGTKYLGIGGLPLGGHTQVESPASPSAKAKVYYPAGRSRLVHVRSFQASLSGSCTTLPSQSPTRAGVMTIRPVSFTGPFKVR